MKEKNKGYVLLIVLILSLILALIGAGLAFMSKQGYLSTRANTLFNKLQKASHYGINEAIKRIVVSGGVCEEGIISQSFNIDGARVKVSTARRGLLCSLRSEANLGGARQVIVATTQGFYGIGTFTVKANERVKWLGGAYVSGCDPDNNCNIPAIIVSGPINGVPPGTARNCNNDDGSSGIYGAPPLKENVKFYDLVPLVFNVNCFYELLHMFETEDNYNGYPMGLGENPFWLIKNENGTEEPRQDIEFDKGNLTSCPNPLEVDEPKVVWDNRTGDFTIRPWISEIPTIPLECEFNGTTLNLSHDLSNCTWIKVKNNINITGVAPNVKFIDASDPQVTQVTISNAGNANVITNGNFILNSKNVPDPLVLYTTGNVNINGPATYIRIVSQGNMTLNTSSNISHSTLITPNSVINDSHDNLTLEEVNVFARRVYFTARTIISGGMFYLFGYVENPCNSGDPDSSDITTAADIGTLENPVLFIMVNSNLRVANPDPINFHGIFFAEGPTCIVYQRINFIGISVWNEPNDFVNVDTLNENFYIKFNYGIINTLNNKYWFVRKFECIKDDPLPYAQAIQTSHSSY